MQCEQFEQILEQQDEGALPKPALAHLESCEACRALSADFGAIHDMALELGAEEIAPPERVWISLRNQLEAEGLIHDPQAAPRSAQPRKPRLVVRFSAPRRCRRFSGARAGRGFHGRLPVEFRADGGPLATGASAGELLPFPPRTAFSRKKS